MVGVGHQNGHVRCVTMHFQIHRAKLPPRFMHFRIIYFTLCIITISAVFAYDSPSSIGLFAHTGLIVIPRVSFWWAVFHGMEYNHLRLLGPKCE